MSGLKPLVFGCLVATLPVAAQAEIVAMDEATLGDVTAQSGLSIELSAAISVGEIAYKDEGFLVVSDLRLAGSDLGSNPNSRLDNVLLTIDVAGDDALSLRNNWGWGFTGGFLQDSRARTPVIQDGDLVIKFNANDFDLSDFNQLFTSVDYGLSIGAVGLAKSSGTAGLGTVLASNIFLTGFLGPIDIIIQEDIGAGTEVMNINGYFTTDGTITADFIGTTFDLRINNFRGQNTFPYAHFQLDIGTRENGLGQTDGLVVNVEDFSGDMDLGDITIGGDAGRPALGDLYFTDFQIRAELVVYGH